MLEFHDSLNESEICQFGTMSSELQKLAERLTQAHCDCRQGEHWRVLETSLEHTRRAAEIDTSQCASRSCSAGREDG
jgi:hypothetical protein